MAAIDDDLLTLERRMMAEGAGRYLDAIDELKRLVALGDPGVAAHIMELTNALTAGSIDIATIAGYANQAYVSSVLDNGAVVARTATPGQLAEVNSRSLRPPPADAAASSILDDAVKAAVKARLLLAAGVDPATAASVLIGNGRSTAMALGSLIVQHAAMGTNDVARITKKPMVWVAERDACVRCLAHSGHVVKVGGSFPAGLTYGPYDYDDTVKSPPLHPHCRCRLEVLNDPTYAEALRREADRSILRGYSLESESMGVRVNAAKKLIDSGVDAPKSVIGYGQKAVNAGKFPTRTVPKAAPPEQPRHKPKPPPSSPPPAPPKAPRTPTKPPAPKPAPKAPTPPPPAPKKGSTAETERMRKELADVKAERAKLAKMQRELDAKLANKSAPIDLSKMTRPAQMAQAVQARHPKTDVSAWGTAAGIKPDQARAALKTFSDLADRFPGAKLTAFRPAAIGKARVMAWVRTPRHRDANGRIVMDTPDMEVALGYARDAKKHHEAVSRSSHSGHFHEVKGEDAMQYTITHEWGHVLDSNTQGKLSQMWARIYEEEASKHGANGSRSRYEWRKTAVSGYGTTNSQEGVAEAFADVEYHGAKALPLNRKFYDEAMKYLKISGVMK